MKPDLCIYHGGCDDGFAAAWAVWKRFGNDVNYFPGVYGEYPPDVTGLNVAIVDFSYKRPVMNELAAKAKSILVLDHHKTAEDELWLLDDECSNVEVLFDMNRSGAVLAWQHFHPEKLLPIFLEYIQDRDLWIKHLPGVDEFTQALRSYPQQFDVWDRLVASCDDHGVRGFTLPLVVEGGAIQRFYRTRVEKAKTHAFMRDIAGFQVPVVNGFVDWASEVAGELAEGHRFAAMYVETEKTTIWSLRSREPDGADVSEIARRFGGGGHKHAAGFVVPRA